jgi:hypothetical protein
MQRRHWFAAAAGETRDARPDWLAYGLEVAYSEHVSRIAKVEKAPR